MVGTHMAPTTFNFDLTTNFLFIYRTLSMRQKTKNERNQESNDKKMFFSGSPIQLLLFTGAATQYVFMNQRVPWEQARATCANYGTRVNFINPTTTHGLIN